MIMSNTAVRPEISYFEYSAINELAHAHFKELGKKLRATIVYGDIVTIGGTYDINLLEVVENWNGPRTVEYASNFSLPLRGQLFVSFLSTSEFENWQDIQDAKVRLWVQELLLRVLRGYEIV